MILKASQRSGGQDLVFHLMLMDDKKDDRVCAASGRADLRHSSVSGALGANAEIQVAGPGCGLARNKPSLFGGL